MTVNNELSWIPRVKMAAANTEKVIKALRQLLPNLWEPSNSPRCPYPAIAVARFFSVTRLSERRRRYA